MFTTLTKEAADVFGSAGYEGAAGDPGQRLPILGEASEHVVDVNGHTLKVISAPPRFGVPPQVAVEFDARDVVILPGEYKNIPVGDLPARCRAGIP